MANVPNQSTLAFFEVLGIFLGLSGCLLLKVTHVQNGPYMDEIFHIGQVTKYCKGLFEEWDPKITTLPGLYLLSSSLMQSLSWFFGYRVADLCTVFWLRGINVILATGNFCLLFALLRKLHGGNKGLSSTWYLLNTATLATFPVLYFCTFLYYTDTGSTFFTLAMYLMHLHGNSKMAAGVGIAAILFRQTNIIWVIFVAGLTVEKVINDYIQPEKKEITQEDIQNPKYIGIILLRIKNDLQNNRTGITQLIMNLIKAVWMYIIVGLGFTTFVIINNGIVVGDRNNHEACLHFPQIFYFCCVVVGFSIPHFLNAQTILGFLKFVLKHPFVTILGSGLCFLGVHFFTYEHKFLLADNRHYTFYIWARIFRRHWLIPYMLIPGYVFAIWTVSSFLKCKGILWKLVFLVCLVTATVPQKLLEFRYFIIPYLIFRLNMKPSSSFQTFLEFLLYFVVNALTLYMFLQKPFSWPNTDGVQRFMW
ncbi:unnamed protein product [Owenia fusiformis]|uniref:Dol-P-Glc:Glc(2)Man(9)GlcNAc(2)-PP-Dol alpha-1,2-glucosyltransferase n=1 Tax=Owenia fusiformis TaxID=6347 RepID=A0A8J1T4H3_OWEFU|nr:unnamed protein product [Owenia fusiformis]